MKHSFYVNPDNIKNHKVIFNDRQLNKIKNTLRLKSGNLVRVCDGIGTVYAVNAVTGEIEESENFDNKKGININLLMGLSKLPAFELALQKAVEIGVDEITPVLTKNSVVKVENFTKKNQRLKQIVISAFCQSRRVFMPKINSIIDINGLAANCEINIAANENEKNVYLKKTLENCIKPKDISILIGPEGGITRDEIKILESKKYISVKLTDTVLRSETAAIYALSAVNFFYGEQ